MILCAEHPHDIVHREVRLVIRKLARDEFVEDAHSKQLDGRLVVGEDIAAAGVLGEALRHGGHHLGIARIRELRAALVKGLLQRVGIGAENLSVSVARDVGDIRALEDARHCVAQILVERAVFARGHVQVHDHDALGLEMPRYLGEEFNAGELKGNGDILICVDHYHVEQLVRRAEESPPVRNGDFDAVRQGEIFMRDVGNLAVYLRALDRDAREIPRAVAGEGAGTHTEDHHAAAAAVGAVKPRHARSGERIVVVHAGKLGVLGLHRLHAEQDVRC